MYLLLEYNRPFAIVEKATNKRIETAIAEEFSHKDILVRQFSLPDWGEIVFIRYGGVDLDELNYVNREIEIMKLVNY